MQITSIQLAVGSGAAAKLAYDKMTASITKRRQSAEETDDVIARAEQFAQKARVDRQTQIHRLAITIHI